MISKGLRAPIATSSKAVTGATVVNSGLDFHHCSSAGEHLARPLRRATSPFADPPATAPADRRAGARFRRRVSGYAWSSERTSGHNHGVAVAAAKLPTGSPAAGPAGLRTHAPHMTPRPGPVLQHAPGRVVWRGLARRWARRRPCPPCLSVPTPLLPGMLGWHPGDPASRTRDGPPGLPHRSIGPNRMGQVALPVQPGLADHCGPGPNRPRADGAEDRIQPTRLPVA